MTVVTTKPRLKPWVIPAAVISLGSLVVFSVQHSKESAAKYEKLGAEYHSGFKLIEDVEGCKVYRNGRGELLTVGQPGVICTVN